MKRLLIATIIFVVSYSIFSQNPIQGQFLVGSDSYGNSVVYFRGNNISQYILPITVICVNETLRQQRSFSYNVAPGYSFSIGPNEGWKWQPREKLYVYYQNGQSFYWTYTPANNPTFTSRRSCQKDGCRCAKYTSEAGSDYPYGTWCRNCNHAKGYHTH
jgi:hypothetical protein